MVQVLEPHKELVLEQHKELELEQHRSKPLERRYHCRTSCERASEPRDLLAWQQEHIRCRMQELVLVLVHKQRLQGRCTRPYERASGSRDLLAWRQEHIRCRMQGLELVLVHSRKQPHRCNPCFGQKYQPMRWWK
jgi:hypothetical protein